MEKEEDSTTVDGKFVTRQLCAEFGDGVAKIDPDRHSEVSRKLQAGLQGPADSERQRVVETHVASGAPDAIPNELIRHGQNIWSSLQWRADTKPEPPRGASR